MRIRLFPRAGNTEGGKNAEALSPLKTISKLGGSPTRPKPPPLHPRRLLYLQSLKREHSLLKIGPGIVPPLTLVEIPYTCSGVQALGSFPCHLPSPLPPPRFWDLGRFVLLRGPIPTPQAVERPVPSAPSTLPRGAVSSVAQLCLTLCDPMDCSTPGFPVHHQLPEFTQTHLH